MQSEIENLKKGVVVETADYKENKKIIGIVQSTVQSVDGRVPPLSKQTAFKAPDEIVMKDIAEQPAIGDYSIPSLETSVNNSSSVSQPLPDLPNQEPASNMSSLNTIDPMIPITGTQLENPVQTNNPSVLESLVGDVSSISKEAVNSISNTLESVSAPIEKPNDFAEPVDLPKIDEPVVAAEPNGLNDSLFNLPDLTQGKPDVNFNQEMKSEVSASTITNSMSQLSSDVLATNNSSDELLKIIETKKGEISDKIAKYMIAASNMLVEEIIDLIKLEMKSDKTKNVQETQSSVAIPSTSEQNEINPFSLSL